MNIVLEEILRTNEVRSADDTNRLPLHSAISAEEGNFLTRLIHESKPTRCVEIGLAYGVSALFICDAMAAIGSGVRHLVIDPFQTDCEEGWEGIGIQNLRRAGFGEMVELIEKPSHIALADLESQGVLVDFALIDGWHTFDHTLVDFFHVDRILRPGGILVIDDIEMPPVRKALRYVLTNRSYQVVAQTGGSRRRDWRRAVTRSLASRWPFRAIVKPEWQDTDEALGVVGSCIALRKETDDHRGWDAHRAF